MERRVHSGTSKQRGKRGGRTSWWRAALGLALLAGLPGSWGAAGAGAAPQEGSEVAAVAGPATPLDSNRDLEVTPAQGPWLICVHSYVGPEAPRMARQLVEALRGPQYRLPAYVFNYAADARRQAEQQRQAYLEQQRRLLEELRRQFGEEVRIGKVRLLSAPKIQDQVAVLVGGYPDMESAHQALNKLRQLDPSGLRQVQLDQRLYLDPEGKQGEKHLVNPFRTAFVVPNPTMPRPRSDPTRKIDLELLRRLNQGEKYSLLQCPKPVTLVVAQYYLPATLEKRGNNTSFLSKIWNRKGVSDMDPAAVPAHEVAEWLRKGNVEAYVLHSQYWSIVTIGGFDSLQDPRLELMKRRWVESRIATDERFRLLNLFPEPVPMFVPREGSPAH